MARQRLYVQKEAWKEKREEEKKSKWKKNENTARSAITFKYVTMSERGRENEITRSGAASPIVAPRRFALRVLLVLLLRMLFYRSCG